MKTSPFKVMTTAALSTALLVPAATSVSAAEADVSLESLAFSLEGEVTTVSYDDYVDAFISESGDLYEFTEEASLTAIGVGDGVYVDYDALIDAYLDAGDDKTAKDVLAELADDEEALVSEDTVATYKKYVDGEATDVSEVSVTAANEVEVEFNGAVDTDAVDLTLKYGFVPQDVTVEWSDDNTTATLTSEDTFFAGDYTVEVEGLELEENTFDVSVSSQTLTSFEVTTDKVTGTSNQTLKLEAVNQYGDTYELPASKFTASGSNVTDGTSLTINANGNNEFVIVDDLSTEVEDNIVVTLVHKETGLSQTANFEVQPASLVASPVLSQPEPKEDEERINVGDDSGDLVLPLTLSDQYGSELTLTSDILNNDLQFVSSNDTIVDPASFAVNGDNELTFETGDTAGQVTLTVISKDTGETNTVSFEVSQTSSLDTVSLSQPTGLVVANEAVTVDYQAYDNYGEESLLQSASDLTWFSTDSSVVDPSTDIAVNGDGELSVTPQTEGSTTVSAYLGGVKQGEFTLNAKAAAVATKITKLSDDALTYYNKQGGEYTYSNADFAVVDQYNRVIDTDNLAGSISDVSVKDGDTNVVNTAGATVTASNDQTGEETLVATYTQGDISLTEEFDVNVITDNAVVDYELSEVPSTNLYDGDYTTLADAEADGYAHTLDISYGLDADGNKVALSSSDADDFLTVSSNSNVTVDDSVDKLFAATDAADDSTATVSVFKKGTKLVELQYTVNAESPELTELAFNDDTLSVGGTVDAVADLLATSKDQYGVDVALAGGTWFTGDDSIATVDASGNVTAVAEGSTNVTYVAPNGVNASFTITVE